MKLPYEYVAKELDKLYDKQFEESDIEGINQHCEFIREFIHACGWTEEQIVQVMFQPYYDMLEQEDIKNLDYWNPDLIYPGFGKNGIN